jgi:hypothetical protein
MFQHYTQQPALKHTQRTSHSSLRKTTSDVSDVYTKWPIFMKSVKKNEAPQHLRTILDPLVPLKNIWRTKYMVLSFKSRIDISTELSWEPEIL